MAMRRWLAVCVSMIGLAFSGRAFADALPPEQSACDGKTVGDTCDNLGTPGKCANATCSRLDYSNGTPPTSVEYACVLCQGGDDPAPPPPDTSGAETNETDTSVTTDTGTTGTTAAGGGCSSSAEGGAGGGAAVAALLALGVMRSRRSAPRR